jgi:phosphate-selective porin
MECQKKFKLITTALIGLGAAAVTTQVLAIQQADHSVIRIGGLVQTDFFTYNEPVFGDGADIRRANAFARGNLDDDWSVQLAINPANSGNILDDSFVGYAGLSPVWLAVGRITPAFGMDAWTSGANTTFMERAAVSTLFAPPSGVGLYAEGDTGMVAFQAAAFAPDHNTNRGTGSALYDFNDPWGYTARVIFNPARDPGYVLHLGASYNYQDFKNSETFGGNFVSNPELYSRQGASSLGAVNADTEAADFAEVYGGELAGAWGPFLVQGEYQKYHLNALTGFSDMDWTGWYLQASWVITC